MVKIGKRRKNEIAPIATHTEPRRTRNNPKKVTSERSGYNLG